jgi:TPP-dependent pyruvate/acetoin dehydrogenase alpha subunit
VPATDTGLNARLYRTMLLIRRVEEHICEVYHTDAIKSPVHLSIGQESVAAGICDPLLPDDMVSNTYRCHATYIAKGGDLKQMMAELYGKTGGCAGGKAGSMHLIDMPHGIMGASAVVGTTIPVAAGYALAMLRDAKKTGRQRIVVSVFGDGATEEGVFNETIHFAALKKLPVLFVCENNKLAIHSKIEGRWPTETNVRDRVKAYGIPVHFIPDADVFALRDTVSSAADGIRKGKGPVFIECMTYRWMEHVGPTDDHSAGYRDVREYQHWKAGDQIARLEKTLDEKEASRVKAGVEAELKEAIAFAESSPYPAPNHLLKNVYAA